MHNDVHFASQSLRLRLDAFSRLARSDRGVGTRHRRRHAMGSSLLFFHGTCTRRAAIILGLLSTCTATILFKRRRRLGVLFPPPHSASDGSSGGNGRASQSLWRFYQHKAAMQSQKMNSTGAYAINIVLTSDIHGRIRSTCIGEKDTNKKNQLTSPTACYPGAAHLSSVVSTVRSAVAAQANEFFVLLDAGDAIFGDPHSNETSVAAVMNKLGYDAMALGNHEWDFGRQRLSDFVRSIDFPILAGNIKSEATDDNDNALVLPTKPYVQINLSSDITLCLLGVTAKEENPLAGPDVKITDEMESVKGIVEELSNSSACSATVLMSHAGIEVDKKIAQEAKSLGLKVDAILGGHSHVILGAEQLLEAPQEEEFGIALPDTTFPLRDSTSANDPGIPVAHVGSAGYFVGLLRLTFRNTSKVDVGNRGSPDYSVQVEGDLLTLDEKHGVRPDMSFYEWQSKHFPYISRGSTVDGAYSTHVEVRSNGRVTGIGGRSISTAKAICGQSCRTGECLLGNLISDSMKSCLDSGPCASALPSLPVRPIGTIGLLESGTVRSCASLPFDDFSEILPWPNKLVILAMKGGVVRKMLNHGLHSMVNSQGGAGAFLQTSGIEYTYLNSSVEDVFLSPVSKIRKASKGNSKTKAVERRSVTFEIDALVVNNVASCQVSSSVRGSRVAISDHSVYFVIVTDWLASGGDGYRDFVAMAEYQVESNVTLSEALRMYTSSSPTVRIEGRSKRTSGRNAPSALREGISAFFGGGVAFLLSYPIYTLFVRRSMAKSIKCSVRRLFDGCWLGFFASAVRSVALSAGLCPDIYAILLQSALFAAIFCLLASNIRMAMVLSCFLFNVML
jgi:5'-nucleotidase/UDP-sugar diphosphatase